jgi:uncharacterized RDD family membrane protein YckC
MSGDATLVTGEAVALDLRAAALPSRLVAGSLDAALQLVLLLVVGALAVAVSFRLSTAAQSAVGLLVYVLVTIVYPVTFETLLRGRTPGKAAMGLRVVRDDGGPIGFRHALARGLLGAVVERPGITFGIAAVLVSSLNGRNKRLGDLLAGTVVVRERVPVRGGAVAEMPPQLAGWAAQLDLTRLSDELALSARQFVSRAEQLTPVAREDLGSRLVAAVTQAVGPAPRDAPGWAVLSAVLAERRRREAQRLAPGPGLSTTARASTARTSTAPVRTAAGAEPQPAPRAAPPAAPPPPPSNGFAPPG